MAVQFILGRSGTGKTTYCIKAVIDTLLDSADARPLIFLVPEQATYQIERAILADSRIVGYGGGTTAAACCPRLNVLSFDRLQFLLLSKNTARPSVSHLGRAMLIQRILRQAAKELKVFGSAANSPGLGWQMAQTIREMSQYAKTPQDIDELLEKLRKDKQSDLTALKFEDVALVFKEYLKFIEGKFIDSDVQLNRARRKASQTPFIKDAKLWVDGFAGFTSSELEMLAELLKASSQAHIALCLDPSKINIKSPESNNFDPTDLFSPTQQTYAALLDIIKKCKLRTSEPIVLQKPFRFAESSGLAHIERKIFDTNPAKIQATGDVRIISAPDARTEIQFVAKQIIQLVREKDCRYRDIAVIAPDISSYEHYIRAYFDDYSIPFFIDKRKLLNQHPVVRLISSALQAITTGFSTADIFSYIKTDLVPVDSYEVDLLDNYCVAFGINGSDWTTDKDWHFAGDDNISFDEQQINQIRQNVIVPLLALRDKLCPSGKTKLLSPESFTRAVFAFLDSLSVCETIEHWAELAIEAGNYSKADEHRQFYERFVDVFDELCEAFTAQEITCKDYLAIIDSAFSQLTLAFIPPTLDQVLVGSVERSRHPDLKAVFLIGATQKQFPSPVSFDSILTEDDRNTAATAGFELAETAEQKLTERRYLAYIAFTRPSQFLYVTYPLSDQTGGALCRSQFLDNLESLFENLSEEPAGDLLPDAESIRSESELADLLCTELGRDVFRRNLPVKEKKLAESDDVRLFGLLDAISSDERLASIGSMVLLAINYDNSAILDKQIVTEMLSRELRTSATRLGTFAACPYRHFARYILELEPRQQFELKPLDVGRFYHCVLDAILKRLNELQTNFVTIGTDELLKLLHEQISKVVQTDSFISNFAGHSAHNAFIIASATEVLEDCVLAISKNVRAGVFIPTRSEVAFGRAQASTDNIGQYIISLPGDKTLSLDGKIDRVDIAEVDGKKIAVVFDYKRTGQSFSWAEFYHGLDMQLPIYLLAVRHATGTQEAIHDVAGAFYMPVELNPMEMVDESKKDKFGYKARGIFNGRYYRQLDNTVSTDWSRFYNFCITKREQQYGRFDYSSALKSDDFESVLQFTKNKIIELIGGITSGKIDVTPYRLSGDAPCRYCDYKSVCRFDWQINEFNHLQPLSKYMVLEKINADE